MSDYQARDANSSRPAQHPGDAGLLRTASGLARIYASAWWHTAEWTVETSVRAGTRLIRAAVTGDRSTELFEQTAADVREYARRLLEMVDSEGVMSGAVSDLVGDARSGPARGSTQSSLRERGAELLRRSADVRDREESHPAYERILEDLAPDEGRILRLLALEGPQPSVDVRAGFPFVSELVAPGRNMIGAEAGCRHLDRVPSYLNNLYRLGLIWFSREPVKDPLRYQVLEAQPEVLAATRKGGRTARTVRRSILLTPFGKDFCEMCLPIHTDELEALPGEAP